MNNYLIAVGGTGQHIALCLVDYLALAHLTTNGRFPVPTDNWKIILIDADQEKSQEERSAWGYCREQVQRLSAAGISIKTSAHKPVEVLDQMFGDTTPATLLSNLSDSPAIAEILLDLLFTSEQSKVRILDGFFGEPRVASFIGGRWLRDVTNDPHHDLGALAGQLAAGADQTRVALAGSSAGGTGAGLLEPLRKWLVSISPQAAASMCVDVGLEWFKISGSRNNALSMRMRHNAASCLFPFLKTNNTHRLGIWGHPSVSAATEESDQNNTRQAVKQNLTLPWFGTAILVDFYSGAAMPPTAAIAADRVSLRGLLTPHHNFNELIEANRRVVGRLQHTQTYLRRPYSGAVLPIPPFRRRGRVATLDAAHANLERRVTHLLDAKRDALERLRASEALNGVGQIDVTHHSVYSTKLLNQLYARSADPAVCAQPIGEALPEGSTQGRLLPEHATGTRASGPNAPVDNAAAGDAVPRGSLAPLGQTERTGLADLDLIAATRIPSLSGVRDLISAFIANNAVWRGSLALAQKPVAPALLRRPTDDRARDWMRRWLLVFRALMAGALRRYALQDVPPQLEDDLLGAQVNLDEILIYEYKGHPYVVGSLDPDYVVIPSVGRIWETEETLKALIEQSGGISRLLTWVNLATRFVGKGRSPDWAKLLETEFKGAMQLDSLTAGKETIELRWNGKDLSAIPLPADIASGGAKLDIAVQRSVPSDQISASPEILAQLAKLEIGKQQIYLRRDLRKAFKENFLGTSVAGPDGTSVSLDGAKVLDEEEFFTPVVVQLKNTPVPYALPIRAEHAEHVTSCSYSMSGSTLAVTLTLKNPGASRVEKKYSVDQILTEPRHLTSLYLWPSHAQPTQRGLWTHVSRDGRLDREVRLLTSDDALSVTSEEGTNTVTMPASLTLETEWVRSVKRRMARFVPSTAAPKRRPRLLALRIDLGSGSVEAGLIPYLPERPVGEASSNEHWCVDFGTSSTAVAVRGRTADDPTGEMMLRLKGEGDSTLATLTKVSVPRKDLRWFSTWDGQAPITRSLAGEMPSHVLVLKDIVGEPELGADYMVDLGWTLSSEIVSGDVTVRERLKWSADPLRSAYNRDVLETMLQIRVRTGGGVPSVLPVTFTLPYRQVTTLDDFKTALDKAIDGVRSSFGVEIKPSFLWESHALRPAAAIIGEGVFVAADLGGGTLDLYAARYREIDHKYVIAEEIIDSALVGADFLVRSWSAANQFPEAGPSGRSTAVYKAAIRSGAIGMEGLRRANDTIYARKYWTTLRRYITAWCKAVVEHWGGDAAERVEITFERLGLGWELYDRAGLPPFTETMNSAVARSGVPFTFHERTATSGGRSRKEELAFRGLQRTSDAVGSVDALKNAHPNMVIGMPLKVGSSVQPAHAFLHDVVPILGSMRPPDLVAAQELLGGSRAAVEHVVDRLNKEEQHDGMVTTAGGVNRLAVSPLTLLAERVIEESEASQ